MNLHSRQAMQGPTRRRTRSSEISRVSASPPNYSRSVVERNESTRPKAALIRRGDSALAFVAGDDAVLDVDYAIGMLGDVGFMGYQHNRIALAMKFFHQLHDFVSGL